MKERVAPVSKPVPNMGNVAKDGGHSILTTPKKDTGGRVWASKPSNKIMK